MVSTALYIAASVVGTVAVTGLYKGVTVWRTVGSTVLYESASAVGTVVGIVLYKAVSVLKRVVSTA